MSILEKLQADLIVAMKAHEELKVETIRLALASLKNAQIEKTDHVLSPDDEITVLRRELKKRLEANEIYKTGNRPDLANKELAQAEIIKCFLPAEMSIEDVRTKVQQILTNQESKDFATVMKLVMPELKGQASGQVISQVVKDLIT